ncbi:hypothetical protein [Amycolatopsis sp. PS_44_ISF1]|uniref:hypothetical protein n=1 Tax=Amycolatopsis sp. PS_44_ISF1 TaxID=2974917 RepID=UPI0028DD64A9|nr:hypothetical protein [Amycolatopsis sp. PS_44_ISF1]MDT8913516.1 hypothetical protein [Amycolatopsis sp. PS_44_ISF1]
MTEVLGGSFTDRLSAEGSLVLASGGTLVEVHVADSPVDPSATLDPVCPAVARSRAVLLSSEAPPGPGRAGPVVTREFAERLRHCAVAYTEAELDSITHAMPMLESVLGDDSPLAGWALIFRDHFVENSVGFLRAVERCGMPPEWIFALSKGDKTAHRDRVHATFLRRGYSSGVLDNSVINRTATVAELEEARASGAAVDRFIHRAHQSGRRVLVVDDGGLLAQGLGSNHLVEEAVDAALELTVSGLKRIEGLPGGVTIPVFNMARSALKATIGYNEIADSCLRRVRVLLAGQKVIGRSVLCVGFGTLGRRLALGLRALGCSVAVVDTDIITLIRAAEEGFATHRSLAAALERDQPFLIAGSTGDRVVSPDTLPLLPDGVFLAGFATKDFSLFTDQPHGLPQVALPGVGVRYRLPGDREVTLLGDGRSLNLFEYEGIPNRGYDLYRAGTLLAAEEMCRRCEELEPGVHTTIVDELVGRSGLYERYYARYLASGERADV